MRVYVCDDGRWRRVTNDRFVYLSFVCFVCFFVICYVFADLCPLLSFSVQEKSENADKREKNEQRAVASLGLRLFSCDLPIPFTRVCEVCV